MRKTCKALQGGQEKEFTEFDILVSTVHDTRALSKIADKLPTHLASLALSLREVRPPASITQKTSVYKLIINVIIAIKVIELVKKLVLCSDASFQNLKFYYFSDVSTPRFKKVDEFRLEELATTDESYKYVSEKMQTTIKTHAGMYGGGAFNRYVIIKVGTVT